ncbi:hypothetical protein [Natranaerobius trueperi]|uniref:Uncharacterized protein n=1 Tax=Natranaerobius trueperi TaxID=759412 RepID=A0A226C1X8_9FIRM|nr:hypothetical protein [Natranaerobius trueperi]OWZ84380.1 hypothetical protein CDO51_03715 [Natranaerobius trueperi]
MTFTSSNCEYNQENEATSNSFDIDAFIKYDPMTIYFSQDINPPLSLNTTVGNKKSTNFDFRGRMLLKEDTVYQEYNDDWHINDFNGCVWIKIFNTFII